MKQPRKHEGNSSQLFMNDFLSEKPARQNPTPAWIKTSQHVDFFKSPEVVGAGWNKGFMKSVVGDFLKEKEEK